MGAWGGADRGGGGPDRRRALAGGNAHGPAAKAAKARARSAFAWEFWTLDWGKPAAGEHTIRSRAFDVDGNVVQPAPDDPYLAGKVTYWESNGQITRRVLVPPVS
jgi:hypothetical protein